MSNQIPMPRVMVRGGKTPTVPTKRTIMVDTSGGIHDSTLEKIRSELRIGDLVACFDTQIYGIEAMQSQSDIDKYVFAGGGGTALEPVIAFCGEAGNPAVIYSDLYFMDDVPALWEDMPTNLYEIVAIGTGPGTVESWRERGFVVREMPR
jgi:hypothetical protein